MITVSSMSLNYGGRKLFEDVHLQFVEKSCYGVIGANGSGKSTFLKILSKEINSYTGDISIPKEFRLGILRQDHFAFDENNVLEAIYMGYPKLHKIMAEREILYAKDDFTDEDGIRIGELEAEFNELGGWEAETDASLLLDGLQLPAHLHQKKIKELEPEQKVKVLLAQALFGTPDLLLLDEPTNHLEHASIIWLEEFIRNYSKTVIVVSHDRHFLNHVCTHTVDIDYQAMTIYKGNYDFWKEMSEMKQKMLVESNKKKEAKVEELQKFIDRFGAKASKATQASSKKKMLKKLTLEDIKPSSRKYPFISFESTRDVGKEILKVQKISKNIGDKTLLTNVSFEVNPGDRIAFLGNGVSIGALFDIFSNTIKADSGSYEWGQTITHSYLPADNTPYFKESNDNIVEWLKQYSEDKTESFLRGFLGRMLFSGEESQKKVQVLSGGEKVRCMFSKLMLGKPNVLLLDGPTNHLDMESIVALNDGLKKFSNIILIHTHDYEIIQSVTNRIIYLTPHALIDERISYKEFLKDEKIQKKIEEFKR